MSAPQDLDAAVSQQPSQPDWLAEATRSISDEGSSIQSMITSVLQSVAQSEDKRKEVLSSATPQSSTIPPLTPSASSSSTSSSLPSMPKSINNLPALQLPISTGTPYLQPQYPSYPPSEAPSELPSEASSPVMGATPTNAGTGYMELPPLELRGINDMPTATLSSLIKSTDPRQTARFATPNSRFTSLSTHRQCTRKCCIHKVMADEGQKFKSDEHKSWIDSSVKYTGERFAMRLMHNYVMKNRPSIFQGKASSGEEPNVTLSLHHVYGYNGNMYNNVAFNIERHIVYCVAAVAVVLNPQTNTQRHYTQHKQVITAMAMHPNRKIVATAQAQGSNKSGCVIHIWDCTTMETLYRLVQHKKTVSALTFDEEGTTLLSVGGDGMLTAALWDMTSVVKAPLLTMDLEKAQIFGARFVKAAAGSKYTFATFGRLHLSVWHIKPMLMRNDEIKFVTRTQSLVAPRTEKYPAPPIYHTVAALPQAGLIAGASDGRLLVYDSNFKLWMGVKISPYALLAIVPLPQNQFLCYSESRVYILDAEYNELHSYPVSLASAGFEDSDHPHHQHHQHHHQHQVDQDESSGNLTSRSMSGDQIHTARSYRAVSTGRAGGSGNNTSRRGHLEDEYIDDTIVAALSPVRSIDYDADAHVLLLGSQGGQLVQLDLERQQLEELMSCPADEACSLDVHPHQAILAVAATDTNIYIYDYLSHYFLQQTHVQYPIHSIRFSHDGSMLALGFQTGHVMVLSFPDLELLFKAQLHSDTVPVVKFSPDDQYLITGGWDGRIIVVNIPHWELQLMFTSHTAAIRSISISIDSNLVASVSKNYDLLFWRLTTGQRVQPHPDLKWDDWSVDLGWAQLGLWNDLKDGGEINNVSVSGTDDDNEDLDTATQRLIAVATDHSHIRLYAYPAIHRQPKYNIYTGHSSHVMFTRFTADSEWLFSAGGTDKAVMQWKISHPTHL